jgi:uncharacterized Ntn-hydrolase superfamily protein
VRGSRILVGVALVLGPIPAAATWSVVAVDPATREVGVAGASCIGGSQIIAGLAPGRGAITAQAMSNLAARDVGAALLAAGIAPRAVLAAVADADFDSAFGRLPSHRLRQYGVAALGFEGASYTGAWTIGWAGSRTGPGVAAQGNMLVGPEVVEVTFRAYQASAGCWLGDRLLRALEAGAGPGGDRRCEPGQAALSAFVTVARPEDRAEAPVLWLTAPEQRKGEGNPVGLLRRAYDAWRAGRSGLPPRLAECGVDGALHEGAAEPRGQGQ